MRYNQSMRTIPREVGRSGIRLDPVETTRRRLRSASEGELKAYLLGALHDATFSKLHSTYRYSQSSLEWLELLKQALSVLGYKAWIYKEGKKRNVWVLETAVKINTFHKPSTQSDIIAYIRGYFDAEGGMPKKQKDFLYFQFSQKDKPDLEEVKTYLVGLRIGCGVIHNPSKKIDDNYWRFFVSRMSHLEFMNLVGSWHPRKMRQMELRMKI
jgi:hypothetical protein